MVYSNLQHLRGLGAGFRRYVRLHGSLERVLSADLRRHRRQQAYEVVHQVWTLSLLDVLVVVSVLVVVVFVFVFVLLLLL